MMDTRSIQPACDWIYPGATAPAGTPKQVPIPSCSRGSSIRKFNPQEVLRVAHQRCAESPQGRPTEVNSKPHAPRAGPSRQGSGIEIGGRIQTTSHRQPQVRINVLENRKGRPDALFVGRVHRPKNNGKACGFRRCMRMTVQRPSVPDVLGLKRSSDRAPQRARSARDRRTREVGCPCTPCRADIDYATKVHHPPTGCGIKSGVQRECFPGESNAPLEHHVAAPTGGPKNLKTAQQRVRSPEPLLSPRRVKFPQTAASRACAVSPPEQHHLPLVSLHWQAQEC